MKTRYPGVTPFTSEQQKIFFGREKDIKRLYKLISLRNQVLLYAKSGIGKTSLLNAGVLPLLEDKYKIIKIRFTAYDEKNFIAPTDKIIDLLINDLDINDKNTFLDEIAKEQGYEKTLWHYFKQMNLINNKNEEFILVFDQFEELFTYPDNMIDAFKQQMHDLLNDNTPNLVKQFIVDHPEIEEQTETLFDDLNIKTVFAIRSDRLSLMNKLTDKLPGIQKNFYELLPLDNQQATEAIVNPAVSNDNFDTKPFEFKDSAIQAIINALSNNGKQNIESTQLQIICEQVEQIAQEKYKNTLDKNLVQITDADLPEFDDIFLNFYLDSIKNIKNFGQYKIIDVQKFIENQLIRNHQRISLDEIICLDYVSKEILKELVDAHLLRAERNTTGGFSYELAHDTLVEPIWEVRKERIEKEEEERLERERQEELKKAKEKAEKERLEREKERKRQRKIIAIVTTAAIISIALAIFGLWQMRIAQNRLKETVNYQIRGKMKDAISFQNQEEFYAAIGKYNELLKIYRQYPQFKYDTVAVHKHITECDTLKKVGDTFYEYIDNADSLIATNNFDQIRQAVELYQKAKKFNYAQDFENAKNRLKTFELKLDQALKQLADFAEAAYKAGGNIGFSQTKDISEFLIQIDSNNTTYQNLYKKTHL